VIKEHHLTCTTCNDHEEWTDDPRESYRLACFYIRSGSLTIHPFVLFIRQFKPFVNHVPTVWHI